jgi:hypothetical protein
MPGFVVLGFLHHLRLLLAEVLDLALATVALHKITYLLCQIFTKLKLLWCWSQEPIRCCSLQGSLWTPSPPHDWNDELDAFGFTLVHQLKLR